MNQKEETAVRSVVGAAMDDLVGRIREEANERGKVASGRTLASLRTTVLVSDAFSVGTLSGADNWKYWGNGRGPGRMPPVGPLQRWITSRGLSLNAWALAKRIAKDGTRDHRLGRPNLVMESIKAWKEGDVYKAVGGQVSKVYGEAFVEDVQTKLKAA